MERRIFWGWQPSVEQRAHIKRHVDDSHQLFLAKTKDMAGQGMATKYECCSGPVWVVMYEEEGVLQQYVRNDLNDAEMQEMGVSFMEGK
jgi:hypothetical protein